MDIFSLLQEVKELLRKIEYKGRNEQFTHMSECPCCGTFAPGQFGCKGEHRTDCKLNKLRKEIESTLSEFSIHNENMFLTYDTGNHGYNQPLIMDPVDAGLKAIMEKHRQTNKSQ